MARVPELAAVTPSAALQRRRRFLEQVTWGLAQASPLLQIRLTEKPIDGAVLREAQDGQEVAQNSTTQLRAPIFLTWVVAKPGQGRAQPPPSECHFLSVYQTDEKLMVQEWAALPTDPGPASGRGEAGERDPSWVWPTL